MNSVGTVNIMYNSLKSEISDTFVLNLKSETQCSCQCVRLLLSVFGGKMDNSYTLSVLRIAN